MYIYIYTFGAYKNDCILIIKIKIGLVHMNFNAFQV